ncbi:unnamed protein product [Heligmosomoides polygyrus]|uniref:Uncharacterized protein n=1 Tax=Heligmosomoides polygyrus TaxID=6339 RepID=A0A183FBG6_HELPZ|nr:unnamed protein product [Heligmosomoides polygyrus]
MAGEADEIPKEPSHAIEDKDSSSPNRPTPDANRENQAETEARIVNVPESPLGRIDRKLHDIKDKTDGLPFIGSRLGFTNVS